MKKNALFRFALILLLLAACALVLLIALPEEQPPAEPAVGSETAPKEDGGLSILFIDVGQADSMLLRCGGDAMLVDGGNVGDSDTIATVLGKQEDLDRLEYIVITHAHEDHAGGVPGALHALPADHLLAPVTNKDRRYFQNLLKAAAERNLEIEVPKPGDVFTLGSATVEVLGPLKDYSETNNTSIILMVTYGETRFLLTGDMEADAEKDLVESGCNLDADLLKVGHHGSGGSSSYVFLRAVTPEYAVIQCGEGNDYGHPHIEALSRLRDVGAKLYRNDLQGDILVRSDGENITVTTARNQNIETYPTETAVPSFYIGNAASKKFHRPDCSGLPSEDKRVRFDTRAEAVSAGYDACGICKP